MDPFHQLGIIAYICDEVKRTHGRRRVAFVPVEVWRDFVTMCESGDARALTLLRLLEEVPWTTTG